MTDLTLVLSIVGVLLALFSFGFTYIKTKNIERRLEEKERIKKLSKELSNIISRVRWDYIETIKTPLIDEDLSSQLELLSLYLVSEVFNRRDLPSKINVEVDVEMHSLKYDEDRKFRELIRIKIKSVEDYINNVEILDKPSLSVYASIDKGTVRDIHELFNINNLLLKKIISLKSEYEDIIQEFCPNILDNIEKILNRIIVSIVNTSVHQPIIEMTGLHDMFSNTTEIGMFIFKITIATDEVKGYIDELEVMVNELDKVRSSLLTTAYA